MKAIILAAGRSSRLYPITWNSPKCLLEIGEKTIIEHQISWLKKCGINDVLVVHGYLYHKIEEVLGSSVRYRHYGKYSETNNLYTLSSVVDELSEDLVILFSDVLLSVKLLRSCIESTFDSCLIVDRKNISDTTMFVRIDNKKVFDIGTHISMEMADGNFVGVAKFSRLGALNLASQIVEIVKNDEHKQEYYTFALRKISSNGGEIHYVEVEENLKWTEIDLKEEYEKALVQGISVFEDEENTKWTEIQLKRNVKALDD